MKNTANQDLRNAARDAGVPLWRRKRTMRSIEHTPSVSPPFQKIEDAVRTTGLSSFFLRKGCRDGSIPCVRSWRTYFINVPGLLEQLGIGGDADGKSAGRDAVL